MPRPARIEAPFGYYHVTSRGNNRQVIFDDELRDLFLVTAHRVALARDWAIFAYALMRNHFHLVLQIGNRGLSDGMRELNGTFARASNSRLGRTDHCFGRRFWSAHLETEEHALASIRYAAWNPPRAGLCDRPEESMWTSFRASAGLDPAPPVLAVEALLQHFSPNPTIARDAFLGYVAAGHVRCQAPWGGPPAR
jgi:REP element-mobilizing transposase RayT